MINHGLFDRRAVRGRWHDLRALSHARDHRLGGLARRTPILAFFFVLFTLSSIGLPGLNGFAGEFLILIGMFQRAWTIVDSPAWLIHA